MNISTVLFTPFEDAGSNMFGSTPAKDWQRLYPASNNDICKWALRSLLIVEGENRILIDSGFGSNNAGLFAEYGVENYKGAIEILKELGCNANEITHVIHTHLHVDHCGGSFYLNERGELQPSFPNAQYIVSSKQLHNALNTTEFENESFEPDVVKAFASHLNLKLIENEYFLFPWLELLIFNGHTEGLLIPVIHSKKQSIVFVGDLIPSAAHLQLKSTMSYDVNQLLSLTEREEFLEEAYENEYVLFFQHDMLNECCSLKKENGRIFCSNFVKVLEL